jgi:DNA-binding response OmpR family regulator
MMPLAAPVPMVALESAPASRRVLLVDSTREVRLQLQALLRTAGYELVAVDGLQAARVELASSRPLLVLVDWRSLPRQGEPGCGLLRGHAEQEGAPVLVVADAETPVGLLEQALREGAEDCLLGPVRGAELLARFDALREASARPLPRLAERRAPRTVLLVGEEAGAPRGLGSLLEACGHHVVYAHGAEQAVALADRHGGPFHLLLVHTAQGSLEEVTRVERLRVGARLGRVPTVVVTPSEHTGAQAFGQVWLSTRTLGPRQVLARLNALLQRDMAALAAEERVPFVCPVEFREVGTWTWASCLSSALSPGALFLRSLVPTRPGAALELRVRLPGSQEVLEGTGLVAWSNPYTPHRLASYPLGMGVLFLGLDSRRLLHLRAPALAASA